jgi:hypothetical protein
LSGPQLNTPITLAVQTRKEIHYPDLLVKKMLLENFLVSRKANKSNTKYEACWSV